MVLKKHVQLCMYALVSCTSLWAAYAYVWGIVGKRMGPQKIHVAYDSYLAPSTQQLLSLTIQKAIQGGKRASALHAEIREQAPNVKKLVINRYKPGQSTVSLTTERPFLLIKKIPSDHFVLSEQGTYVQHNHYAIDTITGLAFIIVTGPDFTKQDQEALFAWAQQLPPELFDQYSIEWRKKTEILLKDKEFTRLTIITTADIAITDQLLKRLAQTRAQVMKKKGIKEWTADIRFNRQLVLSEIKKNKGTR